MGPEEARPPNVPDVGFCEAPGCVKSSCLSPVSGPRFAAAEPWPPASRGSISLLFALVQGEGVSARRRRRGFEGWGRHLRSGLSTAAKQHFALTHPPIEPARDPDVHRRTVPSLTREE